MVRRIPLIIALLFLHAVAAVADSDFGNDNAARKEIVLVSQDSSCASRLSSIELRKLFLGLRTSKDNHVLKPLRNTTGPDIDNLFIQAVMAMSPGTYERRLISGAFQAGLTRPAEYSGIDDLRTALQDIPCSVSYMWANQAQHFPELNIIQILWSGFLTE